MPGSGSRRSYRGGGDLPRRCLGGPCVARPACGGPQCEGIHVRMHVACLRRCIVIHPNCLLQDHQQGPHISLSESDWGLPSSSASRLARSGRGVASEARASVAYQWGATVRSGRTSTSQTILYSHVTIKSSGPGAQTYVYLCLYN